MRAFLRPLSALVVAALPVGARSQTAPEHWAFAPPPAVALPADRSGGLARNPIDLLVAARLAREGLALQPAADPATLLRRVALTLTGLPPSADQLAAFLAEPSAAAYDAAVDALLARPSYGERMAADWLDLARYSDSYGYQVDRERRVWPWRDWVVQAFNDNLSYDRFVTWQLAGDLLPGATDTQVLATTFQRLHGQKCEGGSVPEEFRVEYVADRTTTFATAFLGLTMKCARCHDHKFDPLPQRDFYRLYAFFDDIDEAGLYSFFTGAVPTPTLALPDPEQRRALAAARTAERSAARQLEVERRADGPRFRSWLAGDRGAAAIPGRLLAQDFEQVAPPNQCVAGHHGRAARLTGDDAIALGVGNFVRSQPFTVALWLRQAAVVERAVVFHRSRAWTDAGSRGYQLLLESGRPSASLIHFWPGNAMRVVARRPLPVGRWVHVAMVSDGSRRARGLRLFVDGREVETEVVRDGLSRRITGGGGDQLQVGARFRDHGFAGGEVDELQVFGRALSALEVDALAGGGRLEALLKRPAAALADGECRELHEYWRAAWDPGVAAARVALQRARKACDDVADGVGEIMVMRELPAPRPCHVLRRGAYDAPGALVQPGVPAVLPSWREGSARNRLGLARWLFAPDHPLTARVAINRLWQLCFGAGLVRTPDDFGSQGEPPDQPRLLDWLARDFASHGWDVKRALRQIVTSATFRQRSAASRALRERDPDNRLLARGPSYRLPAEMIRDSALFVSGLLSDRRGGPPVRPYELAESFKPVPVAGGDGLYRRSLYTFWQRTAPAPAMMVFDAAKRDVCTVRRSRTSTPLQALVLLNGPQFVEAARVLAGHLLHRWGDSDQALAESAFSAVLGRPPSAAERAVLERLLAEQQAHFAAYPEQAEALLQVGATPRDTALADARLAAAGVLVSALFNHDGFVTLR